MLPARPIPPGLLAPPPFDPPRLIQEAMGGRQFFFEIGARAIHRVGLLLGLAWRLPFGEAAHRIDFVRIVVEKVGQHHEEFTFEMRFGRIKRFDADGCTYFAEWAPGEPNEPEMEEITRRFGVPLSKLRKTYEEVTGETR